MEKMEVKHHPTFVDFFRFFNMIFVKNPSESWIFLLKKTVSDDLVCSQSIRILEKSSKAAYLVMIFVGRLFTWQCIISIIYQMSW